MNVFPIADIAEVFNSCVLFVRTFYRDAASLNSDNRNAAAAKNVTRFAVPVLVANMSIKTFTMLVVRLT
jgi:hypothetical protein